MITLKDKINRILGNNVRLLLPSYWWKRVFGLVVDRIDEIHPIVDSADALDKLNVPDGSLASIKGGEWFSLSDAYSMTEEEYGKIDDGEISLLKKCTPISSIHVYNNTLGTGGDALAEVMISDSKWTYIARITIFTSGITFSDSEDMGEEPLCLEGQLYEENIRKVNKKLSEKECVITIYEALDPISNVDKFIKFSSTPGTDAYIKCGSWERLVKESDLRGIVGESEGMEIREFYIGESLTDVQKAWNLETRDLAMQNKCLTVYKIQTTDTALPQGTVLTQTNYLPGTNESIFNYARQTVGGSCLCVVVVDSSGNTIDTITTFEPDAEVSATSTNAVQNKVITAALNNKADKIEGKQLSTEDFTTALKTKLEGLNAFDPTEINNKVDGLQTQLDTLVSGDASTAIESFNEIIAFLSGITDSEGLDAIIASIEQQIANKQDKLISGTNIKTINGESIIGEGNIVVNVDTSNLATKEEVNSLVNDAISSAITNVLNTEV